MTGKSTSTTTFILTIVFQVNPCYLVSPWISSATFPEENLGISGTAKQYLLDLNLVFLDTPVDRLCKLYNASV